MPFCRRLLTSLPALETPGALACAAIYLAALETCQPVEAAKAVPPMDPALDQGEPVVLPVQPRPWWELFGVRSQSQIWRIVCAMLDFYQLWYGGASIGTDAAEPRPTIWARAARLRLPLTKTALREQLPSTEISMRR